VNPTFERMTGISRAQWLGRTVREVLPQIEDSWIERFGQVALGGGPIEYEDFVKTLDRHYHVTVYSPQPGRFAVISYDVTERKRAEAALRESEERFRTLVESQGEGIGVVDEQERFVFVNPAAEEIFGVTRGSLAGRTLLEFLDEADRRLVEVQSGQRRAGEKSVYELAIRRPDGAERVLMVTATPRFWEDGAYAGTLGVFRDVTDLKRAEAERLGLERQMQQTQKLESLGVLAGGVAHDFNNLLTSILGNASLAQAELAADGSGQHLREIEEAARRAADLCRQMLAYAGKGRFMIEQLDLNDVIEKMLQLLRTSTSKKAVLKLDLGTGLPAVRGDATQIRQILMNLITNASESLGEGEGVIAVSTTARHCTSAELREGLLRQELPAGRYVCVEVTDTGCGMDPETQRRIFEPFFTTKFTGRGLGLSAVLGIVRGHQGTLQLESRPGEGTTFRVWFPAAPDAGAAGVAPAAAVGRAPWRGSGVVLLVDDEEGVRKVGQRMLERLGFEVVTAADGDEALERYRERKKPFALVLLDLTMPRRDGAETLVELRRLDPGVRVMIASGYTEVDVAGRFAGQELAGFVQKPFDLVELQSRLRAALEGL
jgi:PAS domain S-box-containing protein